VSDGGRRGVYGALAVAIACYLVSDVFYGIQSLAGTYRTGGVVDLGFGPLLPADRRDRPAPTDGGPHRAGRGRAPHSGRLRLLLLGAVALLAPGDARVQHVYSDHVDVLLIAPARPCSSA
jgi:hypothetical protein